MGYAQCGSPKRFTSSGVIGSTAQTAAAGGESTRVRSINKIAGLIVSSAGVAGYVRIYDGNAVDATKLKMTVRINITDSSKVVPLDFRIKGQGYVEISAAGIEATLILV